MKTRLFLTIEWSEGEARQSRIDNDTYLLDYSFLYPGNVSGGGDYTYIRRAKEACDAGKWRAIPHNPFVEYHDTKVITGGSPSIVSRKVLKQVERWKKEAADRGKKPGKHEVQEQSAGEEDSLPFY